MASRSKKLFTVSEALESIFADNDSDNENFDCGSDLEAISDSEDESLSEDSDLHSSLTMTRGT